MVLFVEAAPPVILQWMPLPMRAAILLMLQFSMAHLTNLYVFSELYIFFSLSFFS